LKPWCKEAIDFINVIGNRLIWESGDSKSNKFLFERISQNIMYLLYLIVYYVMRSKNGVLCAAAGSLAANKPAKAHKTIFVPNNILFFFKPS
jgi:hypothetical protein